MSPCFTELKRSSEKYQKIQHCASLAIFWVDGAIIKNTSTLFVGI